jgi:predicted nuclease with TOPRIM domain
MADNTQDKRDLLALLMNSEYYSTRRRQAIEGKRVEEFIKELENFTATLWKSLYDLNQDLDKLKEQMGKTESKSSKLEELLLAQLFDNVTDGVTN